jgi:hypothetical protein
MYHANVFVDNLGGQVGLPLEVDCEVRGILGIESWDDHIPASRHAFQALVDTFRRKSQMNARNCLLDGDWKAAMSTLLDNLADFYPDALRTNMSEEGKFTSTLKASVDDLLT